MCVEHYCERIQSAFDSRGVACTGWSKCHRSAGLWPRSITCGSQSAARTLQLALAAGLTRRPRVTSRVTRLRVARSVHLLYAAALFRLLILPIIFLPLSCVIAACVIVACATVLCHCRLFDCRACVRRCVTCYVVLDLDAIDLQDSAYHTHARRCPGCWCPAAVALVAGATV